MSQLQTFTTSRVVAAHPEQVWEVIAEAGNIAAHAPNLSASEIVSGEGQGMVRRCANRRDQAWQESCTVWEPGRRYTMDVDTSDYPYPMRVMRGTWSAEPAPAGARIGLHDEYEMRFGLLGRLAGRAMRPVFSKACSKMLDSYERELAARWS